MSESHLDPVDFLLEAGDHALGFAFPLEALVLCRPSLSTEDPLLSSTPCTSPAGLLDASPACVDHNFVIFRYHFLYIVAKSEKVIELDEIQRERDKIHAHTPWGHVSRHHVPVTEGCWNGV